MDGRITKNTRASSGALQTAQAGHVPPVAALELAPSTQGHVHTMVGDVKLAELRLLLLRENIQVCCFHLCVHLCVLMIAADGVDWRCFSLRQFGHCEERRRQETGHGGRAQRNVLSRARPGLRTVPVCIALLQLFGI